MLIDEISEAAREAIEQAAAEAAKAATLAAVEREAEALREAQRWKQEAERVKQTNVRNCLLSGVLGFLGGFVLGVIVMRN